MKEIFKKLSGFLIIAGLLVLLSFVNSEHAKTGVTVNFMLNSTEGDPFLDKKDVEDLVYSRFDSLDGKLLSEIPLDQIESLIESNPSVKNAEVYVETRGRLEIEIELKKVIARIKPDTTDGFYVDEKGSTMPWVSRHTPRVLTVSGSLDKYNRYVKDTLIEVDLSTHSKLVEDVYKLAIYMEKNPYWKAQIGQVFIEENGDAVLIPLMGDHEFIIGDLTDCEKKLEKIKVFHDQIAQKVGWEKYKIVNLKFDNQIICK